MREETTQTTLGIMTIKNLFLQNPNYQRNNINTIRNQSLGNRNLTKQSK